MKILLSVLLFLSISTMSFAQIVMNTTSTQMLEPSETVLTEKAINRLATKQTKSITKQLSEAISTQVTYSELMTDNAIEGALVLKVTFTPSGEIASLQILESPHPLLSTEVLEVMNRIELNDLGNVPYYGPEAMIIPISFSLR